MRASRIISALAALALGAGAALAGPPQRVVSVNLCTDQLALALAAPGQVVSVSRLGHDPEVSAMAATARGLHANGSGAEEVYLLRPDLVLAGTHTDPATVQMLRELGVRVALFSPVTTLAQVPERLTRMGKLLGRESQATAQVAAFHAEMAAIGASPATRPRAALYHANSYASGALTLAGDVLRAAGFDNVANEAGLAAGGTLPLERLVMLAPDVIVRGRDYPGQSRAEDNLTHPALQALTDTAVTATLNERDWICGGPAIVGAVREMRDLRLSLEAAQ